MTSYPVAPSAFGSQPVTLYNSAGTEVSLGGGGDASLAEQQAQSTLLGNIDSHVDQLEGYLDGLETLIGATNTNAGALADAVDLAGGATSMASKLRGLVQLAASILAKLPSLGTAGTPSANVISVQGVASGIAQPVTAGGYTTTITTTLTRVADANALAANDAINTATSGATTLAILNAARTSGGSGYITYVRLATDQAANVSAYRLHFYNAAPAVTVQDNAAQSVLATDQSKHIGSVDIPAVARVGSAGIPYSQATLTPLPFVAAATSIFCAVETVTGFTPASGQVFYITVGIEQN